MEYYSATKRGGAPALCSARGRGARTPSARSPRDATECAIPPARGVHGGRSWINGCGAGDGEWEGPLTAAGLPGEVDMFWNEVLVTVHVFVHTANH